MTIMRVRQAILAAMRDEMRADPSVFLMGEDVALAGGPFKTSEGLLAEFGPSRVRDTPISEMAFTGAAVGAAMMGQRPIVEVMFMEFLGVALDQLVTEASRMHYLSNGAYRVPMVLRASTGAGLGFGTQHSQTFENWLAAAPGLKVVVPSDADSAYHLLRAAIRDPGPVAFLEPRALYGERGTVERDGGDTTIGNARHVGVGTDVTVVALGQMVGAARTALRDSSISADLIDLSTLYPWDKESVFDSVSRTGRLAVVQEAPESGGWGHEVISATASACFADLTAPPILIAAPNAPVPYNKTLERRWLPSPAEIAAQLTDYVAHGKVPEPWWGREGIAR